MSQLLVSIIQADLLWEDKTANLARFERKIAAIPQKELVVLPEMFSTGFSMNPTTLAETMDGPTLQWMQKMAQQHRIILTGSLIIADEGHYFNRLIWMQPDGQYGCYDKRHLFAYGGEDQHYSAGNRRLIASAKGFKINLQVCYDLRFPVWSRQPTATNNEEKNTDHLFDVLVYVANWPQAREHAWTSLLTARAIENQCYVVGVNRVGTDARDQYFSGNSMIIDPLGQVIYQVAHKEDSFTTSLSRELLTEVRDRYPFWNDADNYEILK